MRGPADAGLSYGPGNSRRSRTKLVLLHSPIKDVRVGIKRHRLPSMSKLRCEVRDWHPVADLHAGVAVAKVMGRVESQSRRLTPAAHGHAENLSRGSREDAPLRSSIVGRAGLQHVFHEPFRHRHLLSPQRRSRFPTCLPSRTQRRKRRSKARAHSLANGGSCVSFYASRPQATSTSQARSRPSPASTSWAQSVLEL
jgi:hypothetical protein